MKVVLLNEKCAPGYANPGDAAFDLRANISEAIIVLRGSRVTIPTGIKVAVPAGYVGMVTPRSGDARRRGVSVTNSPGLIDAGYTGEVGVILENRGESMITVEPLDRIAQFAVVPVLRPQLEFVDELPTTERGENGFGSSGQK